MKKRVGVVGAGASGLVAAIMAARAGAEVFLFEHMDRPAKKLLSTGNGRCNLTNMQMEGAYFHCPDPAFPMKVIDAFDVDHTLAFFKELGIEVKQRGSYVYPNCDQAGAVADLLIWEAGRLKVKTLLGCEVVKITPLKGSGFGIATSAGSFEVSALILAAGSRAAPKTGSDGSGYALARELGHNIVKPLPALTALRCEGKAYRQMAGVRTEAALTLMAGEECLSSQRGELQLVEYGISGIPVFQLSRYAARAMDEGRRVRVRIDFMPAWEEDAFLRLKARAHQGTDKPASELFTGMLNRKLGAVLVRLSGVAAQKPCGRLTNRELGHILSQLKAYEALVASANPYEQAQVCSGGVDTGQVNAATMESRLHKGLYLAGELLDVDGDCGGYNLQFAWSSGAIAGKCAAEGG